MATISANNDSELGNLIAEIFERTGANGAISVEEGKTLNHEIEFVEGLKFDRGFQSPYFVNNLKNNTVEFENPLILVANQKINNLQNVLKYLEHSVQSQRPLLIISEEVENEALTTLILNRVKGGLKVACVKAPAFGDNRSNQMQDISILTGAQMIDPTTGNSFDEAEIDILGSAKKVIITKDETTIIDGAGTSDVISQRVEQINNLKAVRPPYL